MQAVRDTEERLRLVRRINLQLAAMGEPACGVPDDGEVLSVAEDLLRVFRQQSELLADHRCPADGRIQAFLDAYFSEHGVHCRASLPTRTLVLDRPGMAAELSFPWGASVFRSEYLESHRTEQGVLHNPRNDRRTTQGVFHVVEGGLPIPGDKKAVPVGVFAHLLEAALAPPPSLLRLPLGSAQPRPAKAWVSLLMRPLVSPGVPGVQEPKTMECRFLAPGSLVANLDFVERVFGNGGNPAMPENDAALDVFGWCGTTGCVVIAPHLTTLRARDLGLPHVSRASARQRAEHMCWEDEADLYNAGLPFKVVCRDLRGVIVTLIADNYFGYSKKEIKSQISYSANLFGGCEEEHAGGALVFPRQDLGEAFQADGRTRSAQHTFESVCRVLDGTIDVRPEGYAVDARYPDVVYVPEDARIDLASKRVSWSQDGEPRHIKLLAGHCYVHPTGYKVALEKDEKARAWRLIGTEAEGVLLHKPATVSGGGKSEISKGISGAVLYGPVYVKDIRTDLHEVEAILRRDYSRVFRDPAGHLLDVRSMLSPLRSLGSVIRLLTPSATEYTDAYNDWLRTIPPHVRALVFLIKRYYDPEWGEDWRRHFSVDIVNGHPSHELRYGGRKLIASYLRVGFETDRSWRVFKTRQDFVPAEKVQVEDDITASVVVPVDCLQVPVRAVPGGSVKLVENCELALFQRPDDVTTRGADTVTERHLAGPGNFITNFEPLTAADARDLVDDAVDLDRFSEPMREVIRRAASFGPDQYFVSSAHARLVEGRPSPNVRYLQRRPDLAEPRRRHVAEVGLRLHRLIEWERPLIMPVDAVLPGRRNNPPEKARGIRMLAVYGPIHYQDLPELFMDLICSLSGKSPSTTGAGSEGALTKGPFNALAATSDLNTALVSFVLCGYPAFSTAAGFIGPDRRVDHDLSLLVPEIWCRLPARARDPAYLIANGYLERVEDFVYQGRPIRASRLGYRITERFVHAFFGKVFDDPASVFDEAMLRPETQDLAAYAEGVEGIVEAQRRVAQGYLDDGTVADAVPPLQALLHIMAEGAYQGMGIDDERFRQMLTREHLLASDWYRERLQVKQDRDVALWRRHVAYLEEALARSEVWAGGADLTELRERLARAQEELDRVRSPLYRRQLVGSLGADRVHRGRAAEALDGAGGARPTALVAVPAGSNA
jgi:hypothetical protein